MTRDWDNFLSTGQLFYPNQGFYLTRDVGRRWGGGTVQWSSYNGSYNIMKVLLGLAIDNFVGAD